jgi:hypothetical protein
MLKKGFIPRYWIDPKTGRQMMDYLRGEGNNLVSTNSPALSPQKGTNAIEKSTEEFKQKPPSQPLPPPEEPRSAVIARNIQNNAVRARALRFARARKKNLYSGTRVLRARRGR